MPNLKSLPFKKNELLTYHCGFHGNLVTIATRYVPNADCPKEAPCHIRSQYDLRQRSYKVTKLMSPFQLISPVFTPALHSIHGFRRNCQHCTGFVYLLFFSFQWVLSFLCVQLSLYPGML